MKKTRAVRRQIFVLTSEEQRIICYVALALLLGLATKHYRAAASAVSSNPGVRNAIAQTSTAVSHPVEKRVTEKRRGR